MCGITGIVNLDGSAVDPKILKIINDQIYRRGPDDEGFFVYKNVGLAARRLSIIDLSTGHQPIGNEDGTIWITFNGEIYNFPDIRLELLEKGHKFSTKTDTEAIVHLYEEYGEEFVSHLDGMFAFSLLDIKRQKVILARDRMGEKPLYYRVFGKRFVFASELKAIFKHPDTKRQIDAGSLSLYLSFEYIPAPNSIIKDVFKLPPANLLILDLKSGKYKVRKYWGASFSHFENFSFDDCLYELDRKLYETVKSRMIADVPLGVFLSGGLDSSTITYYMTKISPGKVKSFSIGFADPSFDESKYARKVAKFLGTDHREKILDSKKALELIPNLPQILDEPMADSSILPTYLLSDFTRQYVKVALGGDGGDELFMGYPTYQAHKYLDYYNKIPLNIRRFFINQVIRKLPVSHNNFSLDFKLKRFTNNYSSDPVVRNSQWLGTFFGKEKSALFSNKFKSFLNGSHLEVPKYEEISKPNDATDKIILSYLTGYLPEDILVKTDRASMFASLETRAPFLDHNLVNFINSIPKEYKLHGLTTKYILKKLMEKRLPPEIVYRGKKGFGIPLSKWLTSDLKELMYDYLGNERVKREGIFNPKIVEKLMLDHVNKVKDNRKEIWTLLVFQMWKERWKAEI